MTNTDYYNILGVERNATAEAIKTAYRKLARQHHPDAGGDEEKFKQLNQAYEVLKDKDKRHNYDVFGDPDGRPTFDPYNSSGTSGFGGFRSTNGIDIDDLLNDVFFKGGFGTRRGPQRPMKNPNLSAELRITLEEAFTGKTILYEANTPTGELKKLNVTVPPGVRHGMTLRMSGQGSTQNTHLPPGDLLLHVVIQPHDLYEVAGGDLHMKKDISFIDATLGNNFEITAIDGSKLKINIPEGTQPNNQIRLRGKGMPHINQPDIRGDLYIHINITIPTNLTDDQKDLFLKLRDISAT